MSVKDNYTEVQKRLRNALANPMFKKYSYKQSVRWIQPFQIYGNVYYVGDSWVCVHLIDTGDGLLLIDSGNCGATAMLIEAIYEAGFRPSDVKWMILSHGHVDHIGGVGYFRDRFGTRIYLGEPDARMFKEKPEFSFIQDSPDFTDCIFEPDETIKEGDVLHFGNTTIECHLVPGHTEGCVALFFDAYNGTDTKRCGYYGGFGFNTLTLEHLDEYGDTEHRLWDIYADSLRGVMDQPVDIFLGNHTENNRFFEKLDIMKKTGSSECFIDSTEWKQYMLSKLEEEAAFVAGQKARLQKA